MLPAIRRRNDKPLKIQFFSDIHLEFRNFDISATDADVIAAAGDIGVGVQGIEWLQQCKKPIVYVAGNHEVDDYAINKTRMLCNPRGYTGYQVIDGFSAAKTVEV